MMLISGNLLMLLQIISAQSIERTNYGQGFRIIIEGHTLLKTKNY